MVGGTTDEGLRARKRARTRAHIVAVAARLFAERGFERTAVVEIARAAEVSEQTIYNHFPTKEDLVLDRDEELRRRFVAAVTERDPTTSPAAALRGTALALVEDIRSLPHDELAGSLGNLARLSPTVRRLTLESTDRLADALAEVLRQTVDPPPHPVWAKVQGVGLAWISQTVIDESGRLVADGGTPDEVADGVRAAILVLLDGLEHDGPGG